MYAWQIVSPFYCYTWGGGQNVSQGVRNRILLLLKQLLQHISRMANIIALITYH